MTERHPKWTRVQPGTVIPAGQPYRIEYTNERTAYEATHGGETESKVPISTDPASGDYFVDSSWKPPLVLPTEPTWGIAVHGGFGPNVGRWHVDAGEDFVDDLGNGSYRAHNVLDFIPLTDEQVARIEAAR